MNKINRSILLFKTAFAILSREKKLLLFPFIASGIALVVALFFITPVALYPTGHSYLSGAHWNAIGERILHASSPVMQRVSHNDATGNETTAFAPSFTGAGYIIFKHGWISLLFAVAYFTSMFLGTFCNVAFYHEIMQALNGQAVSIRRGFQFATTRWRAVLMWSLFAGLVGYLIRIVEQRVGFLGKIITSLIGIAWSVACIFIIPTLVRDTETTNPVKLLRHSAGTLRRTWGELVVGFIGVEAAIFFIIFPVMFVVIVIGSYSIPAMMPLILFGMVFLLALPISWMKNLVNSVYRCALFIYATEGVVPEPFDKELLDSAWKVK